MEFSCIFSLNQSIDSLIIEKQYGMPLIVKRRSPTHDLSEGILHVPFSETRRFSSRKTWYIQCWMILVATW